MTRTSSLLARGTLLGLALAMASLMPAKADSIRLGESQPIFSFVPAAVADKEGIFKKHGLDAKIVTFNGSAQLHQAIAAGSIDIGLGAGPEFGFLVKGAPEKAIAAMSDAPGDLTLVTLKDGPIKTIADLKGKRVSMSTRGSLTEWAVHQVSLQQGWGPNGMVLTPLGSLSTQTAALKTHQVDAMSIDAVVSYRLVEEGVGKILVHYDKVVPVFHIHVIYASNDMIKNHPDQIKAFMAAWFEGLHYMQQHKAESVKIASENLDISTKVADELYDYLMPFYNATGKFNPKAMDVIAQSMVDSGTFPTKPELTKYYTEEYLPAKP